MLVFHKTIAMKIKISLLISFIGFTTYAQNCDCVTDLNYVGQQLKNTPSYKSQLQNALIFDGAKAALTNDIQADENIELNCAFYLQRMLKIVKDQHIYVKDLGEDKDYAVLTPVYEGSPEALSSNAVTTKNDPITGIYDLVGAYRVAVVKVEGKTYDYGGYILESRFDNWKPGELKFTLKSAGDDLLGNFYDRQHKPNFKRVKLNNGRLYPERWVNEEKAADYAANNYYLEGDTFQYKDYGRGVHYVRLGSFSGSNENYARAMELLKTLEAELTEGKVIIDLRNNGGGGQRTSNPFLKLFKKRKKNLEFHLIQNHYVGSNSEQFLLKAKKQIDIKTYGENTRGALAYGFGNYGREPLKTPCNGFSLGLTVSKYERYLEYEVVGIPPDMYLDNKTEWISQVLAKIESK